MDESHSRLIHTVCQNHLTNGGSRNSAQVGQFLASHTDHELAETLFAHDPLYVPGKIRSYCTADGLEPVFAELRADFPVWMASAS
jgi:hypothetical protein